MSDQLQTAASDLAAELRNYRTTSGKPRLWASMAEAPANGEAFPDPQDREWYASKGSLYSPAGIARRLYLKSTALKSVIEDDSLSGEYARRLIDENATKLATEWEWFREEFAHEAGRLLPGKANEIEGYHADRWAIRLFLEQERQPLTPGGLVGDGFYTRWVEIYAGSALLCDKIANKPPSPGGSGREKKPDKPEPKQRSATINERMLAEILKDTNRVKGWTAEEWARFLQCGRSTVVETEAWKQLATLRGEIRAERAMNRSRGRNPKRKTR